MLIFVSATNRRLRTGSQACDTGDNNPPGTTRTIDLDGNPRLVRAVDMAPCVKRAILSSSMLICRGAQANIPELGGYQVER